MVCFVANWVCTTVAASLDVPSPKFPSWAEAREYYFDDHNFCHNFVFKETHISIPPAATAPGVFLDT
jgi:hypothetical protein